LPPSTATPLVCVVIPTLIAGDTLAECLRSLEAQTLFPFEVVVVDNSGKSLVAAGTPGVRVISNRQNVGFGAAVNQGFRQSSAPYLATLNDDAVAHPNWLETLIAAAESRPRTGMFASQVLLTGTGKLDSAGMLLAADGSSKQRGHGQPPAQFQTLTDILLPSGSAALYRRRMLEEIGLFDEDFFLYCEDTDLGLRARWAGWTAAYVAGAIVEHRYSHSAGRASPLKAYYVERNRLYVVIKTFPVKMLLFVPFATLARYFWHLMSLFTRQGKGADFLSEGHSAASLPYFAVRAHLAALWHLPRLLIARRRIFATRRIDAAEFQALAAQHAISVQQVAAL
jgi:GT2 family glycosyltransferase